MYNKRAESGLFRFVSPFRIEEIENKAGLIKFVFATGISVELRSRHYNPLFELTKIILIIPTMFLRNCWSHRIEFEQTINTGRSRKKKCIDRTLKEWCVRICVLLEIILKVKGSPKDIGRRNFCSTANAGCWI